MTSCACPARLSTARSSALRSGWVGVEPGVVGGVGGPGTLLGPEGSGRLRLLLGSSGEGVVVVWLLGASHGRSVLGVRCWWWVGLLFEICIVDASIFVAIVVVLCL